MSEDMRNRFAAVTNELLDADERVAIILADISGDKFQEARKKHPLRRINVGIREQLLVNVGAGMALAGMRPIVHTFAPFLIERAFEQIKLGFAHQGVGGVLVSIGGSYDVAAYGRTHQSTGDVALMATLPDVRIHIPGHADEAEDFLRAAVRADDIVYIRLSGASNAAPQTGGAHASASGELVVLRRGSSGAPTVVAVGPMLDRVLEATAGMDAMVLYAATVRPFDAAGLRGNMTGDSVAIAEPYLEGTSAAEISAALSHRAHRLLSIGVPRTEHRRYGTAADHDRAHGLDAVGLRSRIQAWLQPVAA
jgi:transketolase